MTRDDARQLLIQLLNEQSVLEAVQKVRSNQGELDKTVDLFLCQIEDAYNVTWNRVLNVMMGVK